MRITLVVQTFNNLPYLKMLFESVRRYSSTAHEIVVSVDGSEDGTIEWLQEQCAQETFHTIKFAYHKNHGIGYTCNEGLRLATASYVYFISDDMVLGPGWDKEFDRFLNPFSLFVPLPFHTAGSHGGFRKDVDGSWIFPWIEAEWTKDYESFQWDEWEKVVHQYAKPRRLIGRRYFWGEMLASRSFWRLLGGFDERNDVEFGFRTEEKFRKMAYRFMFPVIRIQSWTVFHFGQKTKWRFKNWKGAQNKEEIEVHTGPHPGGVY